MWVVTGQSLESQRELKPVNSAKSDHCGVAEHIVNDHAHRYRVWLPAHYTKLHHWPIVLYLHGSGQRGDDNLRQLTIGLPPALEQYGQRYRCIVVIPQCAYDREWYGDQEQIAAFRQSCIVMIKPNDEKQFLTFDFNTVIPMPEVLRASLLSSSLP